MIDDLLSRLDGVRQTAPDRWIARCPNHEDRTPSLALREEADGRTLIHCYAKCPWDEVLAAIGLDAGVLFPDKPKGGVFVHNARRGFSPLDALRCLSLEATFLWVVSGDLKKGVPLSDSDHRRLLVAATRIDRALEVVNG